MSIQFNDTTNFKGLVQMYEKEIGESRGYISSNTNRLKEFTADVNVAWDDYLHLALMSSGRWQFDDSNHTGDAIYKVNLVSGTSEYPLTNDETDSALILDVLRVAILQSATATVYEDIYPIDEQSDPIPGTLLSESSDNSVPLYYDKTGNTLKLNPTPNYNATDGLKVYINREPSYFADTDTTKVPGCRGTHHKYFALKPALEYARRNNLATYNVLDREVQKLEKVIVADYTSRARDERTILKPKKINYI